ncbi:hypothetical protein K456DRAFT_1535567 [Colletotrichum gloeosporioides 23]|nr:hypothetical protein K456DRAFT_1535567 [Colletotrichum gloeosporioides 23]
MQCSSLRSKDSFAVLIPSSIADAADATDIHVRYVYCLVHAGTLKLLGKRPNKVCDNERTASWLPQYTEMSRNHLARSGLRHLNAGPGWMRLAVTATIFSYIPHLKDIVTARGLGNGRQAGDGENLLRARSILSGLFGVLLVSLSWPSSSRWPFSA